MDGEYRIIRRDDRSSIAGVAAACAAFAGIPILVARILFVISAMLGFGIPLYLALWFLTPALRVNGELISSANRIWGLAIVLLMPVLFIIGVLGLELHPIDALLLATGVGVGGFMVRRGRAFVPTYLSHPALSEVPPLNRTDKVSLTGDFPDDRKESAMIISSQEEPAAKFGGVCSWISSRTGLNVTVVRIAVVVATFFPPTFPLIPFLYGFAIFFVPQRDRTPAHVR